MENKYDHLIKLILIGNSGVGKTSILNQYIDKSFTPTHNSTIGVDFKIKTIIHNEEIVKLQLWDTAGQEHFNSITQSYYRGSEGIMIIFDVTNPESFNAIKSNWLNRINECASKDVECIFIGNKVDLVEEVVVTKKMIDEFLESSNFDSSKYYEVSAKEGFNIGIVFEKFIEKIVAKKKEKGGVTGKFKMLPKDFAGRKGNCC